MPADDVMAHVLAFDRSEPGVPRVAAQADRIDPHLLDLGFRVRDAKVSTTCSYILKGVFGKGQLIVVWGAPGSGKTFLMLELACHIGCGLTWHGRRTRRGVVLYVVAESSRRYVENRIVALLVAYPQLAEADVLMIPLAVDLLHAERGDVARVVETAKQLTAHEGEVVLIVVDTLSVTFGGGDENSSVDMGAYVNNIKRVVAATGSAVVLVHHCGKNEAAGMRGHTALLGAIDAELAIEGDPAGERLLRTGKVREGESHKDLFAFTLRPVGLGQDEDGDSVTTCVIEAKDDAGTREARQKRTGAKLGKNQRAVLTALAGASGHRMTRIDLTNALIEGGMARNRAHEAIAALLHTGTLVAGNGPIPEVFIP